jgi:hypothetical protein
MEEIPIPFMGDNDISSNTTPESIASWVSPNDRIPLLLAISLYETARPVLGPYKLVVSKGRVASWVDFETNSVIIGLKGTSDKTLEQDIIDDIIIMSAPSYCSLSIVGEADTVIEETLAVMSDTSDELVSGRAQSRAEPSFIFAGHSLGGTAAMCLTMKYPNSVGVSFNGGASPTNPILVGPGAQRFTHYHIVGDLISSHMGESAARVVRIKIPGKDFGSQEPHSSGNLLVEGSLYNADLEDKEYVRWGMLPTFIYSIVSKLLFIGEKFRTRLKVLKTVDSSPIPNSTRFILQKNQQ